MGHRYWDVPTLDDGWSPWWQPVMSPKEYKLACCDCGSVHNVEFKIEPDVDGTGEPRVELRMRRNERATGQVRRRKLRLGLFSYRLLRAVTDFLARRGGMGYLQMRVSPGEWTTTVEPVLAPRVYRMGCCDCGLVHDIMFWVGCDEDGVTPRVHFKVRENARATGQVRRWMRAHGEGVFDVGSRVARAIMQRVQGR